MNTSPRRNDLDDNSLAAFLDGTLSSVERDQMAARIADVPEARLVLLEAARYLEDEPERQASKDQPSGRLSGWARPLAATLLVALTMSHKSGRPLDSDWSAMLSASTKAGTIATLVTEGGDSPALGFAPTETSESRSFRLGKTALDLEVLLRANRGRDARAGEVVVNALKQIDRVHRPWLAKVLENRLNDFSSASVSSVTSSLRSVAEDTRHFELGRWAEASRMAAAAGDEEYFEGEAFEEALAAACRGRWNEEIAQELRRLSILAATNPRDLTSLRYGFEQLVRLH